MDHEYGFPDAIVVRKDNETFPTEILFQDQKTITIVVSACAFYYTTPFSYNYSTDYNDIQEDDYE